MATGGGRPINPDLDDCEGAVINAMPNQEYDEALNAMRDQIQKDCVAPFFCDHLISFPPSHLGQIADASALVGDRLGILELQNEYAVDDSVYLQKIEMLSKRYTHVRKTRGDGNCFYRAFGFGYLEYLLANREKFTSFRFKASDTKDGLVKLGYPTFTVEDFHDQFMEVVDAVGRGIPVSDLIEIFRNEAHSNYLVVYLRLVTSCHLQQNSEFFANFVDGNRSVEDFCKGEVEPMDRESDHIHIIAMANALDLSIRVAYVDRGNSDDIIYHDFPEGSSPALHLLYRPGHYGLLGGLI